ncbi:MAG: glycosyl transferase family 1, partial [Dehalococcoidia bacterium]|nr:glycosyl transferase family 1 [Dehalococcoidia bacterium]
MKMNDYAPIVGQSRIEELRHLATRLSGTVVQNINSTATGGGVAEILQRLIPLLHQLGVDARWSVIQGDDEFYAITKKFHNALHGNEEDVSEEEFGYFLSSQEQRFAEMELLGDIILVHDPQPVALIRRKEEKPRRWLWRCHIDVSNPDSRVW